MADIISSELYDDEKNSWGTDPLVFAALNKEFNFVLDAAASDNNHLAPKFFTKEDDALIIDWHRDITMDFGCDNISPPNFNVFVNPPYGRGYIQRFMQKAIKEKAKGVTTVMLVPATLDAKWLPIHDISEIRIITGGRLSFIHPLSGKKIAGNTKGSMLVVFTPFSSPLVTKYVDRDELIEQGKKIVLGAAA
jgi:DNA (cytosine-5)-methyltransferase 1